MPLTSMTGFGRSEGASGGQTWTWEVRSVNGRGFEMRFRLPPGSETLEPRLREIAQRRVARGSMAATLTVRQTGNGTSLKLNEGVLDNLLRVAAIVRARVGGGPPSVDQLLGQRGLIETVEATDDAVTVATRADAIAASFELAVEALAAARAAEGQRLAAAISAHLAAIEGLVAAVAASPERSVAAQAARLGEQVRRLLAASGHALDPARLHQEAALLATRIDVEEELVRLTSHVAAARELMAAVEPSGRKFDFLTQEFNREANTLCAKANAPAITRAGLELKAVIDQMREQIQNIE